MIKVRSSSIDAIHYDEQTQVLSVQFKNNGSIYTYHRVPKKEYESFLKAPSKRKFLNENIHGQYRHRKNVNLK